MLIYLLVLCFSISAIADEVKIDVLPTPGAVAKQVFNSGKSFRVKTKTLKIYPNDDVVCLLYVKSGKQDCFNLMDLTER